MLLSAQTLQLVKLVMTDGVSQEMTQVDYTIVTYLSMQFVAAAGGILFIKAGDKNAEVKAFGRGRETQPEVRLEYYRTGCRAGCAKGYIQEEPKCK